jgi:hypothetical protein
MRSDQLPSCTAVGNIHSRQIESSDGSCASAGCSRLIQDKELLVM